MYSFVVFVCKLSQWSDETLRVALSLCNRTVHMRREQMVFCCGQLTICHVLSLRVYRACLAVYSFLLVGEHMIKKFFEM